METPTGNTPGGNSVPPVDGGKVDLSQIKRGRGRPPGSKSKAPDSPKSTQSVPERENTAKADAAFLAETGVTIFEIVDELSAKSLVRKIQKFAPHRAEDFRKAYEDCGLNAKDKHLTRLSLNAIAQKYSILGKFGPELCLMTVMAQYGVRQLKLHAMVNELVADEKRRRGTNEPVSVKSPEPAPNVEKFPGPAPVPPVS